MQQHLYALGAARIQWLENDILNYYPTVNESGQYPHAKAT